MVIIHINLSVLPNNFNAVIVNGTKVINATSLVITIEEKKQSNPKIRDNPEILYKDKVYILDAKYYKYGVTQNPLHLPGSSSIEKQIVYGEYVETCKNISKDKIYNAFVMPYDSGDEHVPYKFVSVGTADWKPYDDISANYNYVLGILVDTRYLIEQNSKHNITEIERLSDLIVSSLATYRGENKE